MAVDRCVSFAAGVFGGVQQLFAELAAVQRLGVAFQQREHQQRLGPLIAASG